MWSHWSGDSPATRSPVTGKPPAARSPDGRVDVAGVEQHHGAAREAGRAELVFHALAVVLAQFAALPEEDLPGDAGAGLGEAELGADQPPVSLIGERTAAGAGS
jgi:hypothetical protein